MVTQTVRAPIKKVLATLKRTGQTLKQRREARTRGAGVDLVLADRIDQINPILWDELAQHASVFLSRSYLRVLEDFAPDNLQMRYALASQDGKALAIMLFQRVQVAGQRLRKPSAKGLRQQALKNLQENLLLCGNLLVWGSRSLAFAEGADTAQLWHAVGEALYRLRRADKLLGESDLALIKDFAGDSEEARKRLRLLGYRSVDTEPDMVLSISPKWKTFDDYLASMTSSYRSAAKKLLKDCDKAGITLRLLSPQEMLERQDVLQGLDEQVHMSQGLRLATLNPGYLPALAQALGDRFVCRVAERDGQCLGFATTVNDGTTSLGYYIGYDREANAQAPIYLTLLQSTVADAIAFGSRQLSLGRTALEPKAKMGCKPVPLACAVRHRVGVLNWMVSALTLHATHAEPPERNPFKAQEP